LGCPKNFSEPNPPRNEVLPSLTATLMHYSGRMYVLGNLTVTLALTLCQRMCVMLKYFDSFTELVSTVQKHQKYLKGCFNCGFVWCSKKDILERQLTEEEVEEIQRCVVDLSNKGLTVQQLSKLKIKISHGICIPCWRLKRGEKVRKEQQEMGLSPCYGSANDGHCSKASVCKWHPVCVVDRAELVNR